MNGGLNPRGAFTRAMRGEKSGSGLEEDPAGQKEGLINFWGHEKSTNKLGVDSFSILWKWHVPKFLCAPLLTTFTKNMVWGVDGYSCRGYRGNGLE